MEQYVVKMLREKEDLEGKIKKCRKVLEVKDGSYNFDEVQKELLGKQISFMSSYLYILNKRIEYEQSK